MKKRNFSQLEAKLIKGFVEFVGNGNYVVSTKEDLRDLLVEKCILKANQVNALINNLFARGLLEVSKDLFNTMICLTFKGKHAYRCIQRDEMKLAEV